MAIFLPTYELLDGETIAIIKDLYDEYKKREPSASTILIRIDGDTSDRVRSVSVIVDKVVKKRVPVKLNGQIEENEFCGRVFGKQNGNGEKTR